MDSRQQDNSQPFLLRVWREEAADGETRWCGKIQQLLSVDTGYFDDWAKLIELLETMLSGHDGARLNEKGDRNERNEDS